MPDPKAKYPVMKPDAEWKRLLSPAAYQVLRHEGTERPGSSPLNKEHRSGLFRCAGCNSPVYSSKDKFESGTGWPSFTRPVGERAIQTASDTSLFMTRTEVRCATCGGHLGHVFPDGPAPTGMRHCMNGVALTFEPRKL